MGGESGEVACGTHGPQPEDRQGTTTINQLYLTSMVGLQVNVPLFAGGYTVSQQRQALANIERYQQLYEGRRREVAQQVRKEFQNVGSMKTKSR